jgi:hypothetical protein
MPSAARAMQAPMRSAVLILTTISSLGALSSNAWGMGCTIQPPAIVNRCPPLKHYTPQQSMDVGKAREALRLKEPQNILLSITDDAFALRQQCRAMESSQ